MINGSYSFGSNKINLEIDFNKELQNEKINSMIGQPVSVIYPRYYDNNWHTVVNPYLDDYSAYKIINGFDIFQEISSFLSAKNAEKENNMISISDEDQRKSKGFYDYSFKTRPKNHS